MSRIRTIPKAAAELKEKDPNTALNLCTLRMLVKSGTIHSVKNPCINKVYIDLDEVEALFSGGGIE